MLISLKNIVSSFSRVKMVTMKMLVRNCFNVTEIKVCPKVKNIVTLTSKALQEMK
jgi:hypothetical protein